MAAVILSPELSTADAELKLEVYVRSNALLAINEAGEIGAKDDKKGLEKALLKFSRAAGMNKHKFDSNSKHKFCFRILTECMNVRTRHIHLQVSNLHLNTQRQLTHAPHSCLHACTAHTHMYQKHSYISYSRKHARTCIQHTHTLKQNHASGS